jgi:hypothetical protein
VIKYDADDLISLPQAARTLPGNVHPATLWRWCAKGRNGRRLPSLKLGRARYTTRSALQKFLAESDHLADARPTVPLAPSKSESDRYLDSEGL